MNATIPAPAVPVARRERMPALDALRGVALCGILLLNLPWMSWVYSSFYPRVPEAGWNIDSAAFAVQMVVVEGTMRGLFSMLFGAGIILFMEKAEHSASRPGAARALMLRRLGWLFVFGVINSTLLLWPGDILTTYAIAGVLVFGLRRLAARTLLMLGALFLVLNALWSFTGTALEDLPLLEAGPRLEAQADAGARLTGADRETLEDWRNLRAGGPPTPEAIEETRAARLSGYWSNLAFQAEVTWNQWLDWGSQVWIITDSITFILIGMALFRLGVLQGRASRATYVRMALVGYGVAFALRIWEVSFAFDAIGGWEPTRTGLVVPQLLYQPGRLLMTLGHIGLFHLLFMRHGGAGLFRALGDLGRMAFTGYLGQSALAAIAISGFGLALWGRLDVAAMFVLAAIIWIVELGFAVWWFRRRSMGPLETIWRRLTYGSPPASAAASQPAA